MLFKLAVICTSDRRRGNWRPWKMTSGKAGSFLYYLLTTFWHRLFKMKKLQSRRTSLTNSIRRISLKEEENQGANIKQEPPTSRSTWGWGRGGLRALCETRAHGRSAPQRVSPTAGAALADERKPPVPHRWPCSVLWAHPRPSKGSALVSTTISFFPTQMLWDVFPLPLWSP